MEIAGEDSFRIRSYRNGATAVEGNPERIADILRDAARITERLARQHQGTYRVDATRSAFHLPLTKAFPRNTDVETTLTLTSETPGALVREVTPSPEAVTVREHQSFVQLPQPGYTPRMQDPRAGFFSTEFMDFSAPIEEPVVKRYIARHRLVTRRPTPDDPERRSCTFLLQAPRPAPATRALGHPKWLKCCDQPDSSR